MFKRKCLRIGLGLGLIAAICITFPVSSPVAQAGTMQWSVIDTPSSLDNVIVSPSEINDIAIGNDGRTFYAIDIPNSKIYKSLNGGRTWTDLSSHVASGGAALPAWNVVTAPDNPNFVVIVTSVGGLPRNVFISTDGGASWQNTDSPNAENIGTITISPNYGGYDIAIGTRTGAGNGNIYVLNSTRPGDWVSQGFIGNVMALKFSPTYRSDSSLAAISADATGTYMRLGIHDSAANTTNWSSWGPAEVTSAGTGSSPKVNQIITADLELPADFSGQNSNLRRMYVNLDATSNGGIYRLDDTICYILMQSAPSLRISSLAYYGTYNSGKLLAGEVAGNPYSAAAMTWLSSDPMNCSGSCWLKAQKPATGGGNSGYANARVLWSPDGSKAYCATSSGTLNNAADWPNGYLVGSALDESAFSLSTDNGETWDQLSLIDTEIDFLSDVAVTPASDIIYLASVNSHGGINSFDSIWRTVGVPLGKVWERVLCLLSASDDLIMRTGNGIDNPAIYVASRFASDLRQSTDGGQTWNNTLVGVNVTDFAVTSIDDTPNIYVLDNNYVRKGIYNGQAWQWLTQVDTTLGTGYSINATPTGVVVVGDSAGVAAYSLNNSASFTRTIAIPEPGKMQAIADYRFRNTQVLYAASDGAGSEIYYWIIGTSSYWLPMGSPGQSFYGLAQLGTLYGAFSAAGTTAVDRTLEPEKLAPPIIEWDTLTAGLTPGVVFTREPSSLKVSSGINLWAIDDRPYTDTTGRLWNFYDCLSPTPVYQPPAAPSHEVLFQAPVLISPTMNEVIPVYLDTGDIGNVVFKWRHPTSAQEYELWLAKDESFSQIILKQVIEPESQLPERTLPKTVSLEKGKQYFWKVRVIKAETGETGDGPWSNIMSFSTAQMPAEGISSPGTTPVTPPNGTTKETKTLPWIFTVPPFVWIIFALLVVILLVSIFLVSRARR
jgi:hypothetical protein